MMNDTQHNTSHTNEKSTEKLEIEDEESREKRMHDILMNLDSKPSVGIQDGLPKFDFDFGDKKTFMVPPSTDLLSRVQAFLPEIAASNDDLFQRAKVSPGSVDIEELGSDGPYIEMNLGLGVYEQRLPKSSSSSEDSDTEMHNSETSATSGSSNSISESDDSDYDSDSSVDIISAFNSLVKRPIRPLPRRSSTRPQIVVLNEGDQQQSISSSSGEGAS